MTRLKNRQGGATRMAPKAGADFYETPPEATLALLEREKFLSPIWEPACGKGAISKILTGKGYQVFSSDLFDFEFGETGIDFLMPQLTGKTPTPKGMAMLNIVTNPPYNLVNEFIKQALSLNVRKIAFLLRVGHLEGQRRYRDIYSQHPPARVYVFPQRLKFWNGRKDQIDAFKYPHAWFVWDKNAEGPTELHWIDPAPEAAE